MGVRITCQGLLITFIKLVLQLKANLMSTCHSVLVIHKPQVYVNKSRKKGNCGSIFQGWFSESNRMLNIQTSSTWVIIYI